MRGRSAYPLRTKRFAHMERKLTFFFVVLLCVFQTLFSPQVYSQTAVVKGRVTTSRGPVQYASVTFEDESDVTRKFSALTDVLGSYQLDIILTSVGPSTNLPRKFEVDQNYPNPFSSSTAIPYELKTQSDIQVTIYDILGRIVRTLNVGQQSIGLHNVLWDGRNSFGRRVASGVYFFKLSTDGESHVRKMILNQNAKGFVSLPQSYSSTGSSFSGRVNETQKVQGTTFAVRVENASATTPVIISQELENVVIQNDTTINLSVDYFPTASIDFDRLHQIIRGFGAANIIPWRPDMTDSEIETAFGTGEGQLGFSILRLMIQPDNSQWSRNVSTAKKALDKGVLIFASPWDPPSNMLETVNGQKRVRHDMYKEYAAHLDAFATYMRNNGVPLYAVSVQNEPDYGDWTRWTADEMFTFVKENAQDIGARVIAPESFQFRRNMSDPILNDSVACANLDIVGGHIYGAGLAAYPLAEEKGKEVWMTEHYTESQHSANTWSLAINVAVEMQRVMEANMNAYVWWYIVRYYGPIGDGEKSTSYPNEEFAKKSEITKRGHIMSQFARFIRPGFYRVESSVYPSSGGVDVTAYKDPSSSKVVIVAINTRTTQVETVLRIQNGAMITTLTPYTTSESKNCQEGNEFGVTSDNLTLTLDPSSITTFVSN
jgi:glucuronoarabinoxylan endo-1,4-beta-xylanase